MALVLHRDGGASCVPITAIEESTNMHEKGQSQSISLSY
jgi:hypothetical protein